MNEDQKDQLIEQLEDQLRMYGPDKAAQAKLEELSGGESNSWADQVNACKSKTELEVLVLEQKGIDIDKRKKLKDLKVDALEM